MVERKRHLAKAITYRLFGSAATAGIAFVATGNVTLSASIGAADTVAKIGLYYLHERLWYRVQWGVRAGHAAEAMVEPKGTAPMEVSAESMMAERTVESRQASAAR